jgi:hypothetical protein
MKTNYDTENMRISAKFTSEEKDAERLQKGRMAIKPNDIILH